MILRGLIDVALCSDVMVQNPLTQRHRGVFGIVEEEPALGVKERVGASRYLHNADAKLEIGPRQSNKFRVHRPHS